MTAVRPRPDGRLTDRQRAFVRALWEKGNATRAAAEAGYTWPSRQGPRLRTFPAVAAAIRAENARRLAASDAEWKAEQRARLRRLFPGGCVTFRPRKRRP